MKHNKPLKTKSIGWTLGLVVVAVLWTTLRPQLETWFAAQAPSSETTQSADGDTKPAPPATSDDNRLPDATDTVSKDRTSAAASRKPSPEKSPAVLQKRGRDYVSAAGLIYAPGSRDGHRKDHVLRHARDDPSKPVHGVFDDKDSVFALVDQAYEKVKSRSPDVTSSREGNRTVHTIKMRRRVGHKGGRSGRSQNYPPLNRIRLVLENKNRVITAYPY